MPLLNLRDLTCLLKTLTLRSAILRETERSEYKSLKCLKFTFITKERLAAWAKDISKLFIVIATGF